MIDDLRARVEVAARELVLLTTCRCAPDWTERGRHEPNAPCDHNEDARLLAYVLGVKVDE